ncbi:hypothetical protein ACOMHN_042155 [Nucella lapillus]
MGMDEFAADQWKKKKKKNRKDRGNNDWKTAGPPVDVGHDDWNDWRKPQRRKKDREEENKRSSPSEAKATGGSISVLQHSPKFPKRFPATDRTTSRNSRPTSHFVSERREKGRRPRSSDRPLATAAQEDGGGGGGGGSGGGREGGDAARQGRCSPLLELLRGRPLRCLNLRQNHDTPSW